MSDVVIAAIGRTPVGRAVGLEAMCVGGGQGMAMIIERLS
jgi:acetyl-CoA acetyltransferase